MIPKDPFMLVSWLNTQLGDLYPSLEELGQALNLDRKSFENSLASIDFRYDPDTNSFV